MDFLHYFTAQTIMPISLERVPSFETVVSVSVSGIFISIISLHNFYYLKKFL